MTLESQSGKTHTLLISKFQASRKNSLKMGEKTFCDSKKAVVTNFGPNLPILYDHGEKG